MIRRCFRQSITFSKSSKVKYSNRWQQLRCSSSSPPPKKSGGMLQRIGKGMLFGVAIVEFTEIIIICSIVVFIVWISLTFKNRNQPDGGETTKLSSDQLRFLDHIIVFLNEAKEKTK